MSEPLDGNVVEEVLAHDLEYGTPGSRYGSWRRCYDFFGGDPNTDRDKAALHLGFYLASWGMYRASSFLFKRDFTVHYGAVEIVTSSEACELRGTTVGELIRKQDDILALVRKLEEHYHHETDKVSSSTLTSKILLGTLGCCIGLDQYARSGLRSYGLPPSLDRHGLTRLHEWAAKRIHEIECAQSELAARGVKYPQMKILDMILWRAGRRTEQKRR